jgi:putative FmdB family regulatory protein
MIIYEYQCLECKEYFDIMSLIAEVPVGPMCPHCGSYRAQRIWNAPNIKFKGKGWYSTDNKKDGDNLDV